MSLSALPLPVYPDAVESPCCEAFQAYLTVACSHPHALTHLHNHTHCGHTLTCIMSAAYTSHQPHSHPNHPPPPFPRSLVVVVAVKLVQVRADHVPREAVQPLHKPLAKVVLECVAIHALGVPDPADLVSECAVESPCRRVSLCAEASGPAVTEV